MALAGSPASSSSVAAWSVMDTMPEYLWINSNVEKVSIKGVSEIKSVSNKECPK